MKAKDKKENIDDYFPECKGEHAHRIGIYHPPRVCHVDPKLYCSRRYEFPKTKDKILRRYKYFCNHIRNRKDS